MGKDIPGYKTFLVYEQFYNDTVSSPETLLEVVRLIPKSMVTVTYFITVILFNQADSLEGDAQKAFAHEVARHAPTGPAVLERLNEAPASVLVTEEHLAVLFRLIIEHGNDTPPKAIDEREVYEALLRSILMLNGIASTETGNDGTIEDFVRLEMRSLTFDSEEVRDVIRRYAGFFEWSRTDQAKTSPNYCDLDADLNRFLGMSYDEYAACALCFIAYLIQFRSAADLATKKPVFEFEIFSSSFTQKDCLKRFFDYFLISLDSLLAAFAKEPETFSGASLRPLMTKPLVQMPAVVIAPYPRHLRNLLGTGLYFTLMDAYRDAAGADAKDRKEAVEKYSRFFGEFFEQYIVNTFKESYHIAQSQIFPEKEYLPGVKSTDLVIFENRHAIFVEVVAKRFNYISNIQKLDAKSIAKDLEAMIFEKVKQLDRNIKDFAAGILAYDGIDPSSIDAIFPIIVTVVPVPQFVGFPRLVDAKIVELGYLTDAKPLQFMPAEALEMLVPAFLAGHSLADIIESKLGDNFWKSQSLRNFLVIARPELLEFPPPANPRFELVKDIVRRWGLAV